MKVLAAAALVLLLGACGNAEDATTGGAAGGPASTPEPATSLTVTVMPNGTEAATMTYTLECDPPGGNHPLSTEACAALDAHPDAFAPVRPDMACTMIFGGPEQATITGTFKGEEVSAQFNRGNGCEIERWDSLAPMFKIAVG